LGEREGTGVVSPHRTREITPIVEACLIVGGYQVNRLDALEVSNCQGGKALRAKGTTNASRGERLCNELRNTIPVDDLAHFVYTTSYCARICPNRPYR
jgi:hypothetical protein